MNRKLYSHRARIGKYFMLGNGNTGVIDRTCSLVFALWTEQISAVVVYGTNEIRQRHALRIHEDRVIH